MKKVKSEMKRVTNRGTGVEKTISGDRERKNTTEKLMKDTAKTQLTVEILRSPVKAWRSLVQAG